MEMMQDFVKMFSESLGSNEFVKLTLSKNRSKGNALRNIYIRLITIKEATKLSFTYHFQTNDQVKNFAIPEGLKELADLLNNTFKEATLFTTKQNVTLRISKKGKATISKSNASKISTNTSTHDRQKVKRTDSSDQYLQLLGITDNNGQVIPKMVDKYRQINKYLEIIEGLVQASDLSKNVKVIDMGSGKGYLTFAFYAFLNNKLGMNAAVTGVELRKDLVDYCNEAAEKCGFDRLKFECASIDTYKTENVDILIALHACDTATDDAIAAGMQSNAELIICAPCCHKQIRQQLKGKQQKSPLLKYGIFKERQFEMVTDTIRALILEKNQYESKIFEFISNEHTRKNVMLIGTKSSKKPDINAVEGKIQSLKKEFGIEKHYLEQTIDV